MFVCYTNNTDLGYNYCMKNSLEMFMILPVNSKLVYEAWLDSQKHSEMTGSKAEIDLRIGGEFYAWDGYISGTTLELKQNQRIVQA